jgi:hypothetical protein
MAKAKIINVKVFRKKTAKKRPGIHAKKKSSKNLRSKNYTKKYRGQGR